MSDIRTSFYYDPIRQGYDTNSWRTLQGAPAVVSGRIQVDQATGVGGEAIHYADILKGDISFNVNVPIAPIANGDARYFGVSAPNTSAYIRFAIASGTLTCQTSDGITTTTSASIAWDTNWTAANIVYKIRWEPGTAKFSINGTQVYSVTDASVPAGPLALYLSDNSASSMSVGDMNVRGTQSFTMNPKTSDSTSTITTGTMSRFETVTITENIALTII